MYSNMMSQRMVLQDRQLNSRGDYMELSPGNKRPREQAGDMAKVVLIIKPFAPKPEVIFDKVNLHTEASRTFYVRNPDPVEIQVELLYLPPADRNLHLDATSFNIPGDSEVPVTLTWKPTQAGSWYDTLHFKNNKGHRGAITVALEALALKKSKAGKQRPGFGKVAGRGPTRVASTKPPSMNKVASKPQFKVPMPTWTVEPSAPVAEPQMWRSLAPNSGVGFPAIDIAETPSRRETYVVTNNNKENRASKLPTNESNAMKCEPFSLVPTNTTLDVLDVSPPKQRRLRFLENLNAGFACSPIVHRFTEIVPPATSTLFSDTNFSDLSFASRRCSTASKSTENCQQAHEVPVKVSPRVLQFSPARKNRLSSDTYVVSASNSLESSGQQMSPSVHRLEWSIEVKHHQEKVQLTLLSPEANFDDSLEISPRNNQRALITEIDQVKFEPKNSQPVAQEPMSFDSFLAQPITHKHEPVQFEPLKKDESVEFDENVPEFNSQGLDPSMMQFSLESLRAQVCRPLVELNLESVTGEPSTYHTLEPEHNPSVHAPSGFQQDSLSFSLLDVADAVGEDRQRQTAHLPAFSFTISPPGVKSQQPSSSVTGVVEKLPSPPALDVNASNMFSDTTTGLLLISPPKRFAQPVLNHQGIGSETVTKQQASVAASNCTYKIPYQVHPHSLVLEAPAKTHEVVGNEMDDYDLYVYNYALADAMSSKKDPFYKNPLLSDAIKKKFEIDFVKWLNSVLTPPEELCTGEFSGKVDAADLWTRSTKTGASSTLAPTKETVTFRYLSVESRYDQLRQAARLMFKGTDMVNVLGNVRTSVDAGKFKIRDDRALHVEQGLRNEVLGLFLSFNPLWLRLGLETVFNVTVPVKSNTDVPGLAHFIVHRLFTPEAVVQKPYLLQRKEYLTKFNRVVIKKFLSLVYFLDHAKTRKLIRHDPCLFRRNSAIKSSKELLVNFTRLVLAGEGDITRHLGYMGYKVFHKQGFLDEFRYSVEYLGVDLRDGIRLVRVVELLTGKCNLSSQLRVPPGSLLQKIFNVKLALRGLEQEGYEVQNLKAEDIVAGHREKTLSLLWQMLHRFQYPRLERAAQIIQKWWRNPSLKTVVARRTLAKRRNAAAVVLQKHYRGHLCRRNLEALKTELQTLRNLHSKARIIQRCLRRYMLRKNLTRLAEMKLQNNAAILIQRNVRVFLRKKRLKEAAATKIQSFFRAAMTRKNLKLQRSSAIIIQRFVRGFLAKKELSRRREERAAVRIQTCWRSFQARSLFRKIKAAAMFQRAWRCYTARQVLYLLKQQNELKRNKFAATIQRAWRCYAARQVLSLLKQQSEFENNSAATIQRAWRFYAARKVLSSLKQQNELKRNKSAATIQCAWRCYVARQVLYLLKKQNELKRNNSAATIQRSWRCYTARQVLSSLKQQNELKRNNFAATIQRAWRCCAARKVLSLLKKQNELKRNNSAATIQRAWRCYAARQVLSSLKQQNKLKRNNSAATIQRAWRCYAARQVLSSLKQQNKLKRNNSAATIQRAWRCYAARQVLSSLKQQNKLKRNNSAATIQHAWRCYAARQVLSLLKQQNELKRNNSAETIQRAWRCYAARQVLSSLKQQNKLKRNNSAATIQHAWRCYAARQVLSLLKQQNELKRNNSAATIQRAWRCYVARQVLSSLKQNELKRNNSAATIQRAWRCYTARQVLSSLKQQNELKRNNSAETIQRAWRCYVARQVLSSLKQNELKRNNSAATIQRAWRCYTARQVLSSLKQQNELNRNNSATIVQRAWRCYTARQVLSSLKQQNELKRNNFAATIQRAWRCCAARQVLSSLKQQNELKRNNSAATIQRAWRCYAARKVLSSLKQQNELKRNNSAATIQRAWRCYAARKVLSSLKQQNELKRDNSVAKIQRAWRCYSARQVLYSLKKQNQLKTNSVATIQRAWRCYTSRQVLLSLKQQNELKRNNSAATIQRAWRCHAARQVLYLLKKQNELKINSVATIQRAWRCYTSRQVLLSLKQQNELKMANFAATIQRAWRCYTARQVLLSLKQQNELKRNNSAATIQRAWRCCVARQVLSLLKKQNELENHSVATIQRAWRCYTARKVLYSLKKQYELKRNNSAVMIQRVWRYYAANCQLRKLKASVTIQKTWRAFKARQLVTRMKQDSREKAMAATRIQQAMRNTWRKRAMTSLNSLRIRGTVDETKLQTWEEYVRNYSTGRDANLLIHILKQEKSSADQREVAARRIQRMWHKYLAQRTRAATMIQALWRGYVCRRNIRQVAESKQAVVIKVGPTEQLVIEAQQVAQLVQRHERIQEVTRNVTSDQKIAFKIAAAHAALGKTMAHDIYAMNIFNYYLTISETCVPLILPSLDYILGLMVVNNRSTPAMEIAQPASGALLSLAKHPISQPVVWQHPDLITGLQVVLVASKDGKGSNENTFNNVSTVLWMLARDPAKKQQLKKMPGFVFKLQSTLKFVKGKEQHNQAATKRGTKPALPTLRYNKNPRCFATRLHGLRCLMESLGIKP